MAPYRNYSLIVALTLVLLSGIVCNEARPNQDKHLTFATNVMQDVLPGLVKSLQQKVSESGAAAAVCYCNEFAPQYGKTKVVEWSAKARSELNAESFRFRRISSRNRNPQNAPTDAQARILDTWQKGSVQPAYFEDAGKFYTMHPIKLNQPLCLSCHGDSATLDKKSAAEIKRLYPQDKATGYKLGDLRGAFVTETSFASR